MTRPVSSRNVTASPALLTAKVATFVFASAKLMVPPAVNARFVSMMPAAVAVMVDPVTTATVAKSAPPPLPGVTSAVTNATAPAAPVPMVSEPAAILCSSALDNSSLSTVVVPVAPMSIVSPPVFDFRVTAWPVAVMVPSRVRSSAVLVRAPDVEVIVCVP